MAEVKNSFLKSKMNQDLDDRLIPNGEYRSALNISIGKSETDDVGVLQNVLGNEKLPLTNYTNPNLKCIGAFMDNQNNRIFQFLTDYTQDGDSEPNENNTMQIALYDLGSTPSYKILVQGHFLNFAKNKECTITGVNLIEGLLFWTDNRNQPRKINVNKALSSPTYYINETQISVAKYSPVDPISLYRKITTTADGMSVGGSIVAVTDPTGIEIGMTMITDDISGSDFCKVAAIAGNAIILSASYPGFIYNTQEVTFLSSTMTDKSNDLNWPGDPNFLEDKYIRFSYRFKYDDNEYSLMAPFTQIAYIPKQNGFFIDGNETDAYRSTVINWFENNVNNIELLIPLPDRANNLAESYKITELDVLYKESDSTAVKVLETIPIQTIVTKSNSSNVYIQPYQSQKPYKTLPEDQTIRVYDKVPVRAKAQESAGNRIIYGNYLDKYTPPSIINYNTSIQPKSGLHTNFIEYPNHTLKQNRNYQVGFVLADKYGRQSPVILSAADANPVNFSGTNFGGSTIYSNYTTYNKSVRDWFGNALFLIVNSPITSEKNLAAGTPGLYATPTNNEGFAVSTFSEVGPLQYQIILDAFSFPTLINVPEVGEYLRGEYTDYVEVISLDQKIFIGPQLFSVIITVSDTVSSIYNYSDPGGGLPDVKFAYNINPIGWYSYKVVVRQQQQDYYNVYLPGMLNGYPTNQTSGSQVAYSGSVPELQNGINTSSFPVGETDKTAHIVLINDNINKVPRDLSEVGPDQKQYRSSVQLYGRVENVADISLTITGNAPPYNSKTTTITYDTATNPDFGLVKPGDGIQCTQANTLIPGLPGLPPTPNPNQWYANTVVVSNEVVGTVGTITFEPANNMLTAAGNPITVGPGSGDYVTFPITRSENKQYFPTRKADTVNSIAAASEFNFLDNTVDNVSGTAGLNFYQLQNKPLIGRVSTVNSIGVTAEDMVPCLSVYETDADESLLDIFWETSTTGLISDLNADVSNGYNGPVSFTDLNYTHFEGQDPSGTSTTTGALLSRFVTDPFFPKNSSDFPLLNTSMSFASIVDGTGSDRLSNFELIKEESGPNAGSYRIAIKNSFVFNNDAAIKESYTFTFNVNTLSPIDNSIEISTQLTATGRLGNNLPSFSRPNYTFNITQSASEIGTFIGDNGSFSNSTTGLQWRIISGNIASYFSLNPQTGLLELINNTIPLGVYTLVVRLTDAVDFSSNPPLGTELTNTEPEYASQYDERSVVINVGNEPVPYLLRQNLAFASITNTTTASNINTPTSYPFKYGIAYVGNKDITLDVNSTNANLPIAPGSLGKYQNAINMEIVNGQAIGISNPIPTGLTQGTLKWTVKLRVNTPDNEFSLSESNADVIIYYRDQETSGATWSIVNDDNNVGFSSTWEDGVDGLLSGERLNGQSDPCQIRTITFNTTNPNQNETGEWAIAFRIHDTGSSNSYAVNTVTVGVEDANFLYTSPDWDSPSIYPYVYYTGVQYGSQTKGIPYVTRDTDQGVSFPTNSNTIVSSSGTGTVILTLQNTNENLTPGLIFATSNGASGVVQLINYLGDPLKIVVDVVVGTIANSTTIIFNTSNPESGVLYTDTAEGTAVKQFYTDLLLTNVWNPPVADRFYNFWRGSTVNYNNGDTLTSYPFFSAKVNANGKVTPQIFPAYNVETYANNELLGRNVYGYIGPSI